MKFSVLMSIYKQEEPKYFNRAMQSIWNEQSVKPNEILLVQDGPLTAELYESIDEWKTKIGELFKIIPLEKNLGLGESLNVGIKHCSYELIARMDTDDISTPNRFEKQLKVFEENNIDVCSGFISEFEKNENDIISYRKVPQNHVDIVKYSKTRNPLNHVTVMMKKTVLEQAGGYKHMLWMEDYYLWVRMIINNAKLFNLQEQLVNVRTGNGMLDRRRGIVYIKAEILFLNELRRIKYITRLEYLKNILIKIPLRLLPRSCLKVVYCVLRSV